MSEADSASKSPSGDFWFKPKHHGYGAVPANWKGWVSMTAFTIALTVVSIIYMMSLPDDYRTAGIFVWFFGVIYVVSRYLSFVRRKTDGEWMWRHKGKPLRDMVEESGVEEAGRDQPLKDG